MKPNETGAPADSHLEKKKRVLEDKDELSLFFECLSTIEEQKENNHALLLSSSLSVIK